MTSAWATVKSNRQLTNYYHQESMTVGCLSLNEQSMHLVEKLTVLNYSMLLHFTSHIYKGNFNLITKETEQKVKNCFFQNF